MGKTVEVNLPSSTLLDDNFRAADEKSIQSVSGTVSDLSATFSREGLLDLCKKNKCDSLRIYPAARNNELIMIALGVNGNDELVEANHFCLASNEQGAVPINGAVQVDGVERVPTDLAKYLVVAAGSGPEIVDKLNEIRQVDSSQMGLKVLFDDSFFTSNDFDDILFEVIDVKFNDTTDTHRTIIGQVNYNNNQVSSSLSLLPCPPNCGGTYGNE
ncbi:hypothetical protein [Lewinella sp. LCG006]|uniref:hypothetical protein n=1 Tax=Lewinella sp. LCG006 TaxID=3231911 RepID=UPI003461644F